MADMVSLGTQTVNVGDNVAFTTNRIGGNCQNIRHEPGSGRVTLLPGLYRDLALMETFQQWQPER